MRPRPTIALVQFQSPLTSLVPGPKRDLVVTAQPIPIRRLRDSWTGAAFPHVAISWTYLKETARTHPNRMSCFSEAIATSMGRKKSRGGDGVADRAHGSGGLSGDREVSVQSAGGFIVGRKTCLPDKLLYVPVESSAGHLMLRTPERTWEAEGGTTPSDETVRLQGETRSNHGPPHPARCRKHPKERIKKR